MPLVDQVEEERKLLSRSYELIGIVSCFFVFARAISISTVAAKNIFKELVILNAAVAVRIHDAEEVTDFVLRPELRVQLQHKSLQLFKVKVTRSVFVTTFE